MSNSQSKVTYRPPGEDEPPFGGVPGVPMADLDEATWQRLPAHLKTSVIAQEDRYYVPRAWRDDHVNAVHDDLDQKDARRRESQGLAPLKPDEVDPAAIDRTGLPARPEPAPAPKKTTTKTEGDAPKEAIDG